VLSMPATISDTLPVDRPIATLSNRMAAPPFAPDQSQRISIIECPRYITNAASPNGFGTIGSASNLQKAELARTWHLALRSSLRFLLRFLPIGVTINWLGFMNHSELDALFGIPTVEIEDRTLLFRRGSLLSVLIYAQAADL
jgi:hypothetical protein